MLFSIGISNFRMRLFHHKRAAAHRAFARAFAARILRSCGNDREMIRETGECFTYLASRGMGKQSSKQMYWSALAIYAKTAMRQWWPAAV